MSEECIAESTRLCGQLSGAEEEGSVCLVSDVWEENHGTHLDSVSGACPEEEAQRGRSEMQGSSSGEPAGSH